LGIWSIAESIERQACCNYGSQQSHFWYAERQLHLRQILTHIGAFPLGKPEVLVARAEQVSTPKGNW
jgi:hypothetical protein